MSDTALDQPPVRFFGVRQMNPVAKSLILEALRSREYTQTTQALRIGDDFCVLGVVCDVFCKATGRGEWVHDPDDDGCVAFVVEGAVDCVEPPVVVVEWCGWFDDEEGTWLDYNPSVGGKPLTVWNDSDGKTFPELADLIEEHL